MTKAYFIHIEYASERWYHKLIIEHSYNVQTGKVNSLSAAYCQTYNIRHTLVGNKIVDISDVVGASPVDAAPTTYSF